jgi:hypothetical protein
MKCEVAVTLKLEEYNMITLYATPDAAADFAQFGDLSGDGGSKYTLYADPRFDFKEIVRYIENYATRPEVDG